MLVSVLVFFAAAGADPSALRFLLSAGFSSSDSESDEPSLLEPEATSDWELDSAAYIMECQQRMDVSGEKSVIPSP